MDIVIDAQKLCPFFDQPRLPAEGQEMASKESLSLRYPNFAYQTGSRDEGLSTYSISALRVCEPKKSH